MKPKGELKQINSIVDKGKKIRYLMDLLEQKNIQLKYLKNKVHEFQLNAPQPSIEDGRAETMACFLKKCPLLDGPIEDCWGCIHKPLAAHQLKEKRGYRQ